MSSDVGDDEHIAGPGLALRVSIVPWDSRAFGFPVAQVDAVELTMGEDPAPTIDRLESWLDHHGVRLVSCRLDSDRLRESMLLEDLGFRFVEMVYSPVLTPLPGDALPDDDLVIAPANDDDRPALDAIAATVFVTGRHILDPRLDARSGHERYRRWLEAAMADRGQHVLKASVEGTPVGFFVVEHRSVDLVYWHLTAIAAEAQGQGLGKRLWRRMIARHHADGAQRVETTISAHNTPVVNLYAGLGFRFTSPRATYHWLR